MSTTFLIPYLKEKVDAEKFEKIKAWTKVAVEAAEMIYNGAGRGAEKKAYVLDYLNQKGYKLDSDSIDKLIESAVLELKKSYFNYFILSRGQRKRTHDYRAFSI